MKEVWLPIPEWEGLYEISNFGRARNARNGRIKPHDLNNYGYARVQCYDGKRRSRPFVHRLVALLFVDGYSEGLIVNHKDNDRTNNMYYNLEWVTKTENLRHVLSYSPRSTRTIPCVLTTSDGTEIHFQSVVDCAKSIGLTDKRLHHSLKNNEGFIPEINATFRKSVSND